MVTLTFIELGALEVAAPPPYVFFIGGLLLPFFNCPLLMASSILVPQPHNSSKELIGNDKCLLLCRKQILDNHVDLVLLIWLINHFGSFPFNLVMYSEKVSLTPCLVVSKSLKVTSIIVLKMN